MEIEESVILLIIFVVLFIGFIFVGVEYSECAKSGGDYVRGLIWFNCLK